jgi:hypothetical protein
MAAQSFTHIKTDDWLLECLSAGVKNEILGEEICPRFKILPEPLQFVSNVTKSVKL